MNGCELGGYWKYGEASARDVVARMNFAAPILGGVG